MGQLLHAPTRIGCCIHPTPLRANSIDSAPHKFNFGWYMPIVTTRVIPTEALQPKLLSQMFQAKFLNSQTKLYQFEVCRDNAQSRWTNQWYIRPRKLLFINILFYWTTTWCSQNTGSWYAWVTTGSYLCTQELWRGPTIYKVLFLPWHSYSNILFSIHTYSYFFIYVDELLWVQQQSRLWVAGIYVQLEWKFIIHISKTHHPLTCI